MERRKKTLAIITTIIIVATIFAPLLLIKPASAGDPDSWYTNVSGVLASDYYSLYPFNAKSLKIGFSKFGEMIDSRATQNVGLEYGGERDAFAPVAGSTIPTDIPKEVWLNGWLINITYTHQSAGARNVWATAQHSDLVANGSDWIRVDNDWYGGVSGGPTYEWEEDPRDPGRLISDPDSTTRYGGRKTNGTATTDDLKILYNSPRMFIGRTVTHVKDWIQASNTSGTDVPLVDVVFTIIFNKDKKEVIVLKDIKVTYTKLVVSSISIPGMEGQTIDGLLIQFSNRGEWDLGPTSGTNAFRSYAHFYHNLTTVYDGHYHLNPTLPGGTAYSKCGSQPQNDSGTYDMAQIISADYSYVGWAAYWPSVSDYSVSGASMWYRSMDGGDTHSDDGATEPWRSPYLIGEWDFILTETRTLKGSGASARYFDRQFRGVTVYGITDRWDGDDAGYSGSNVIDTEVQYQLEEIFNPWDLYTAVHKDTRRWVEFHNVTTAEKTAADAGTNLNITLSHRPVRYSSTWEDYCNFSERVIWGGALKYPARSVYSSESSLSEDEPYELYVNATGYGNVTIRAASVPAAGTVIKILYSTNCTDTYTDTEIANYFGGSLSLGNASLTSRQSGATGTLVPNAIINSTSWTDVFGIVQNITILYDDFQFNLLGTQMPTTDRLTATDYLNITVDIKIPPAGGYVRVDNSTYFAQNVSASNAYNVTFSGNMSVMYKVNPPDSLSGYEHEYVHINGTILIAANHTLFYSEGYIVTANYTIADAVLTKEIMGRYEWVVVGNHSRAIDSIGAAMVAEAFKEKQVIADNGGLDMPDTVWGPNIPNLLSNMGYTTWRPSGPAWCTYYDSIGRLALKDDWCYRYPVASSNIITVAGPSANLVSEYFNEFSQAIQIYGGIPNISLSDVIFATTCWNTTAASNYLGQYYYSNGQFYTGSTNTGIGVITTYKDLNGTVGFLIHGWSGDDTYYTCKWFQEYGIYYLQTENRGVTTLVIRLNYNNTSARTTNPMPPNYTYDSHNPQITILERLGTISEKDQHDP